ncbi:helix-turn-helix domain-containing protein [Microbacterium betulae]|uniref:Helix-turn-helix domain-containing protein n=1 Tax=Microbacterium betulae TaxID=2981139 RepID=A0AA97FKP5_9MICO|nr:helix-turn-helix domain-containing protein [Microbacterium sp. AB]WOF23859.1 helix-turn-helix domain-containing protein [Microbacterium sp. AB]
MSTIEQLRDVFADAGIRTAPTVTRWGEKTWTVECVSALTRRQIIDALPADAQERKLAEADAYSTDLDVQDTITIHAHAYRRDLGHEDLTLDRWLYDLAQKIPAGYQPARIITEPGTVRPSRTTLTAEEIAARRHLIGLTLEELAAELGVNPRSIRRWEAGTATPSAGVEADLERLVAEHTADTDRYPDIDENRPRGWVIAALARRLDRAPGDAVR